MYKLFTKFFLWYSNKLGYEVSITRDKENSYEYYTNGNIVENNIPSEKLETPFQPYITPNVIIGEKAESIERPKFKTSFKTSAKITHLDLKMVQSAGGVATLMAKKINEMVNAVNLINFNNFHE